MVESLSVIKSYKLQYRKQESDSDEWLEVHPKVIASSDGLHYTVVHDFPGLEPGTYEAVLRAENAYGWSYPSPPNLFSGEGKRLRVLPPTRILTFFILLAEFQFKFFVYNLPARLRVYVFEDFLFTILFSSLFNFSVSFHWFTPFFSFDVSSFVYLFLTDFPIYFHFT